MPVENKVIKFKIISIDLYCVNTTCDSRRSRQYAVGRRMSSTFTAEDIHELAGRVDITTPNPFLNV